MSAAGLELPSPPRFTDEQIAHCKRTGDYMPMVFEWYKFTGMIAFILGHIMPESPAFRPVPPQHYYVLMGLLNRCARLMLSNVAISNEGKFGETTAIVDRCIFESAIKVIWLCFKEDQDEFNRFIASGLKTEIELKAEIQCNIAARGGMELPIETRMLRSISNHISASCMTEAEIIATKPMRNVASLLTALGHDRLFYVIGQKIGSHHVHGTWPSLLFHYIQKRDDNSTYIFGPRGNDCNTHINQFLFGALFVVNSMQGYSKYLLEDETHAGFWNLLESVSGELQGMVTLTEDISP